VIVFSGEKITDIFQVVIAGSFGIVSRKKQTTPGLVRSRAHIRVWVLSGGEDRSLENIL